MRRLLLCLGLLAMTGCTLSNESSTTGNMADAGTVHTPAHQRWFTGQLTVEPSGHDRACLLLVTPHGSFALRPTSKHLTPVAWEQDGQFDATRSGIAAGHRLVAPYSRAHTIVRGAQVSASDPVCGSHPSLAFTRVAFGRQGPPTTPSSPATSTSPTAPTSPPSIAAQGGGPSLGAGVPEPPSQWLSGRLIVVPGNQGHGQCLALDTSAGAYTLGSSTNRYDVVVTVDEHTVDPRKTGIHIHGRTPLGMARLLGQQAEVHGEIMAGTDETCSRYHTFAMDDLR